MNRDASFLFRNGTKRGLSLAILLAVTLQTGCASKWHESAPVAGNQFSLGRVAVVAAALPPVIKIDGLEGPGEGALNGAGLVFPECKSLISTIGLGGCTDVSCLAAPAALLLGLLTCVVIYPPVGAVAGAVTAPSDQEARAAKDNFSSSLDGKSIQEMLHDKVVASTLANSKHLTIVPSIGDQIRAEPADYRFLATNGVDSVVEVAVTKVGLEASSAFKKSLHLTMTMTARVRVIRMSDNAEIYSYDEFKFRGKQMTLSAWSANQAEQLRQELKLACESLGEQVVIGEYNFIRTSRIKEMYWNRYYRPAQECITPNSSIPALQCKNYADNQRTRFEAQWRDAILSGWKPVEPN